MKQLNFCMGLPRSGSTVLMNILQQNPEVFTTSTDPLPFLYDQSKIAASTVSEFIAMEQFTLNDAMMSFLREGSRGWFESLTDKPVVISKSRVWDTQLNTLFYINKNSKFIICVRDLRDIICSFEKLIDRLPVWKLGGMPHQPMDIRIQNYCTETESNLGRPLQQLPHVIEWMHKKPNNFYLMRFEDFCDDPKATLSNIYNWLGISYYDHDLNNIKNSEIYEHDTAYRSLVTHKTSSKFEKVTPSYPTMLTEDQSATIITNNSEFYQFFYPEIYDDFIRKNPQLLRR